MRDFDLKRLQNTQLEILKEIDRICRKYNIEYFGTWGTALGAIRHKGFIPWDDDIDISMKWDDYVKFEEVCKSELDKKFFLQNSETDKYFWNPYNKLRINNTTSMDKRLTHLKCHWGICMDIFPIVAVPNSKLSRFKQKTYRSIYIWLGFIPYILYVNPNEDSKIAKIIRIIPKGMLEALKKWLIPNKGITGIKRYLLKEITKYDLNKSEYYEEIFSEAGNTGIYKKEIFDESILVPFENVKIPIPKEYDKYLSQCYGDYMKMPDESQRGGHGDTIVDFDKSYEIYKTNIK